MGVLTLIGMGSGNPEHLTLQAIRAINAQDVILIPQKGAQKADLAELRFTICSEVLTNQETRVVTVDLPQRDETIADYRARVDLWHDAIARSWQDALKDQNKCDRVALLVWGDPSLYDSTLRIAARLAPAPELQVIPGITSLQALTAAHRIPLNEIAEPFMVTTGRQLRATGWPPGVCTLAVMLDGACAFQGLDPEGLHIWWGAYVGMPEEITRSGPLSAVSDEIVATRAAARAQHGWMMDIYLLRKAASLTPDPPDPAAT
ncbi:MAG: precorrin-6A synthase (deacetylating) [Pseudomonadota bacterium]